MKNNIAINAKEAGKLAQGLNELLANFEVYYQNLRGFHWNIQGSNFFALHPKFEELYNEANLAIDQIAERVRTLGATPYHTFSDFLKVAEIAESKNVSDAQVTVSTTVNNITQLLELERNLLKLSEEAGDEGTNTMVSDLIVSQEKTVWMLSAFLGK